LHAWLSTGSIALTSGGLRDFLLSYTIEYCIVFIVKKKDEKRGENVEKHEKIHEKHRKKEKGEKARKRWKKSENTK
jgi:hypothetical protein